MPIPNKLREAFKDAEYAHAYFDEFLNISIATQIKVLREQYQLTQSALAELAGMRQERISVLENVNYASWSINTLRKIAKAFGLTLKVSFETFGSRAGDMKKVDRASMQRVPLAEELEADRNAEEKALATHIVEGSASKAPDENICFQVIDANHRDSINFGFYPYTSQESVLPKPILDGRLLTAMNIWNRAIPSASVERTNPSGQSRLALTNTAYAS